MGCTTCVENLGRAFNRVELEVPGNAGGRGLTLLVLAHRWKSSAFLRGCQMIILCNTTYGMDGSRLLAESSLETSIARVGVSNICMLLEGID